MQAGRRFKSPFGEVIVYVVLKLNLLPDEAEAAAAAHKSNFNFGDSVFYCEHIFFSAPILYFPAFFSSQIIFWLKSESTAETNESPFLVLASIVGTE